MHLFIRTLSLRCHHALGRQMEGLKYFVMFAGNVSHHLVSYKAFNGGGMNNTVIIKAERSIAFRPLECVLFCLYIYNSPNDSIFFYITRNTSTNMQ